MSMPLSYESDLFTAVLALFQTAQQVTNMGWHAVDAAGANAAGRIAAGSGADDELTYYGQS